MAVLNKWTTNGNTGIYFCDVYNMVLDTFIVRNCAPSIGIPVRIMSIPYLARLSDEGKIEIVETRMAKVTGIAGEAASTAVRKFTSIELKNVIKILGFEPDFPDVVIVDATLLRILAGGGVNFQDGGNCLCHAFSTTTGPTISRQPTLNDCLRLGMKLVRTVGNGLALAFARSRCHELWTYDDSCLTLKTFHENVSTKCQRMDRNILGKQVASLSEEEKLCRMFVYEMERKVESGVYIDIKHVESTTARFGAHSDVQHIVESMAARRPMTTDGVEDVNWRETLIGMANEIVESGEFGEIAHNDRRLTFGKITIG